MMPRRPGRWLPIALGLVATLFAGRAAAQARTPEQEVLAFMIGQYGRHGVVSDSTFGIPCERMGECARPRGVPRDAWAAYLQGTRSPSLLRDLLPSDVDVTFASARGDETNIPCGQRSSSLTLSRAGVSANGRVAVIWWDQLVPMDHLGSCGASRGGLLLLKKTRAGVWKVDRPLRIVIS
jgi:hypothetical protein